MKNEETIFAEAAEIVSPEARAAYLELACGGDAALRREVDGLLAAHERAAGFMESPTPIPGVTGSTRSSPTAGSEPEAVGATVGPYQLLERIGEGGMGSVYMADQLRPVRRRVALKIIKPGMDSCQVVARFEAERQALSMMDHPGIARVLDAGTTDAGRPYFAMELVKGVPITDYCDANNLTPRERLGLFVQVCQAVQHAHTKGVIHRDLKPTNVLVTMHDGLPVPKIIDFGIAKATGGAAQQLTDKTLFTHFAQMIGTPFYMSPEQAEFSGLDVDTRSDVYSLGVLLYELLTGTTPFDKQRLGEAALDEVRRIIREEEPPRPSTRLSTLLGATLTVVSANRKTDAGKLGPSMRGELDWIVMRALEKDRTRRYETANGLAMDVQRYLADEEVQACPPSAMYRFRKFARRRRAALVAVVLLTVSTMVALGGIGWALRDLAARDERSTYERATRQARVSGRLEIILDEVARLERAEKWAEALVSARRAEPALAADEAPPHIQERVRRALADLELVKRLEEIRMESGTTWRGASPRDGIDRAYAAALMKVGVDVDAQPTEQAVALITARGNIAAALLPALGDWVAVRSLGKDEAATRRLIDVVGRADSDPWRQRLRDALARKDWPVLREMAASPELDRQPAATFAFFYASLPPEVGSHLENHELILQRAQRKYPADFWVNHRLACNLMWGGRAQEGIGFMRAAVAVRPNDPHAIMNLGNGYAFLGQDDEAVHRFREAIKLRENFSSCHTNLGLALARQGLLDEAIAAFDRAIELAPADGLLARLELSLIHSSRPETQLRDVPKAVALARGALEILPGLNDLYIPLGVAHYREGKWEDARAELEKSQPAAARGSVSDRWRGPLSGFFLAMSHWQLGQREEAQQWYWKAVALTEMQQPHTGRVGRFRAEAKELLGITDEKPTTQPPSN